MCLYTVALVLYVLTHAADRNPALSSARNSNAPPPVFSLSGSDYESGEKMKGARRGASPYEKPTADSSKAFLRFPTTVPNDVALSPAGFSNGSVFGASQICLHHPNCHLLFPTGSAGCKRQRRGTRYGLIEKVGGRNRRGTCVFRKFPRSPMCKYLSGSIGADASCCMHMLRSRCSARIRTHSHAYTGAITLRAEAAVCIGELCEYMHKNVCFRVPAPSPSISTLRPDPFRTSLPRFPPCLCADVPRPRRRHRRAYARRENVFGSGTCRPNVNLSGTSRNDYAHDLHRAGGSAIMYPRRHRSTPRERQSMRMLAKRTTNFVFGYRFV